MSFKKSLFNLESKNIAIVGGSGVVGTMILEILLQQESTKIFCIDKKDPNINSKNIEYINADVNNREECKRIAEKIPSIDTVVFSIHSRELSWRDKSWEEYSFDELQHYLTENSLSHFLLLQELLPIMKKNKRGNIIFISSIYGEIAPPVNYDSTEKTQFPLPPLYSFIKAGEIGITKYLSRHLAQFGITTNALLLGPVDGNASQEIKNYHKKNIPLNELVTTDNLAGPLIFLISDASRYITGETLHVSGGYGC